MMTELVLVEGVSDVQLISYYLQNVFGWKYDRNNTLGIVPLDKHEHIENLKKNESQLVLCGVGGNGRFSYFIDVHRIENIIVEHEIASLMIVTDRDADSVGKIARRVNGLFEKISLKVGEWNKNEIVDSFGQKKYIDTYLMIIPAEQSGALEKVIIDALRDIPEEKILIQEVTGFMDSLKTDIAPELKLVNKSNKATVGTFFSVKDPQNAMRSFGNFISKIEWSRSDSLNKLFLPLGRLGEKKNI